MSARTRLSSHPLCGISQSEQHRYRARVAEDELTAAQLAVYEERAREDDMQQALDDQVHENDSLRRGGVELQERVAALRRDLLHSQVSFVFRGVQVLLWERKR